MTHSPDDTSSDPGLQLGRLFAVPMVIVLVIVGCAVVVVLAFGAIVSFKEVPVGDLLAKLESASGERSAGVLMPLWLAMPCIHQVFTCS